PRAPRLAGLRRMDGFGIGHARAFAPHLLHARVIREAVMPARRGGRSGDVRAKARVGQVAGRQLDPRAESRELVERGDARPSLQAAERDEHPTGHRRRLAYARAAMGYLFETEE